MLKIWDLIKIGEDNSFTYYLSNNSKYAEKIKIANDKVSNFENAVEAGRVDRDRRNQRRINEQ